MSSSGLINEEKVSSLNSLRVRTKGIWRGGSVEEGEEKWAGWDEKRKGERKEEIE